MERSWYGKVALILGVTLLSLWYLTPTWYYFALPSEMRNDTALLEKSLPSWAPKAKNKLNLGLDLQGGIHLVMRVDVETALKRKIQTRGDQIKAFAEEKKLALTKSEGRPGEMRVVLSFPDEASLKSGLPKIEEDFSDMYTAVASGSEAKLAFRDQFVKQARTDAVEQAIKTVRNRVDQFGVAEPEIAKRGADGISVELPGFKDPERAKQLIGATAQLEFKIVDDENPTSGNLLLDATLPPGVELCARANRCPSAENTPYLVGTDRKAVEAAAAGKAPEGNEFLIEKLEEAGKATRYRTVFLKTKVEATGENLVDARAAIDQQGGRPYVSFTFNTRGAQEFGRLTENNIRRRMAIILDGTVMSAPTIQSKITSNGQITLGSLRNYKDLLDEAKDLALVLKSGALPAPVTIGEERTVGASLGEELISRGWKASALGVLLVVIFMAVYYRGSGLVADVALVLNALLVLAVMAMFNSTLSLPGIAGFVLTLGIAVDANVLINERIREELKEGRTPAQAVEQGYGRAFWTIFDAHVTSLVAGFILRQYGSGPVRGFATTLIIGLFASLFTSIFVSRVMVDYLLKNLFSKKISV